MAPDGLLAFDVTLESDGMVTCTKKCILLKDRITSSVTYHDCTIHITTLHLVLSTAEGFVTEKVPVAAPQLKLDA